MVDPAFTSKPEAARQEVLLFSSYLSEGAKEEIVILWNDVLSPVSTATSCSHW